MIRPDGLYQVQTATFSAGFVVEGGRVTRCAPILRRRLAYWLKVAVLVQPFERDRSPSPQEGENSAKVLEGVQIITTPPRVRAKT